MLWFALDGAGSVFDDGAGLALTRAQSVRHRPHSRELVAASAVGNAQENRRPWSVGRNLCAAPGLSAVGPAQEAAVAPRKKPPSPPHKSETDAKANEKITLCNNFAQLSLQSQQRCAQTRTSSPERQ